MINSQGIKGVAGDPGLKAEQGFKGAEGRPGHVGPKGFAGIKVIKSLL